MAESIKLVPFAKGTRSESHEDNSLADFQLTNVRLGEIIGSGTFSAVYEVEVEFPGDQKTLCAGKQIRERKESRTSRLKGSYQTRLEDVCVSLWLPGRTKVQHPNLVDFVGVWFQAQASFQLPLLVTEKMETSLTRFLMANTEEKKQLTILRDVACGLDFLHDRENPIVHGDLTANAVLVNLEHSLVAKISDVGLCIILNKGVCPTWPSYRAPEAWKSDHEPCITDDLYSYGVLMMHTLLQECPDSRNPDTFDRYSENLEHLKHNPLLHYITACLDCDSLRRPPANSLLTATEAVLEGETPPCFTPQSSEGGSFPLPTAAGLDEVTSRLRLQVSVIGMNQWLTMHIIGVSLV